MRMVCVNSSGFVSRPAWGAWIEIGFAGLYLNRAAVAPRMGRVD